ncbi:MAG: glycosyltransferase family 2 protein [bacterium]
MKPEISVIILCRGDARYLKGCVRSLERSTRLSYELILVDNASPDNARAVMRDIRKRSRVPVTVIRNAENRYFAGGNNQGLGIARGKYVLFLNADTLCAKNCLEEMHGHFFSEPALGAAGPLTDSAPGLQLRCGGRNRLRPGIMEPVPWIIGFCMMMPAELARRLGGFDETYGPGGYEDYDLCLRIRLAGRGIGIALGSFVTHFGGRGYSGMDYDALREKNRSLYRRIWSSRILKAVDRLDLLSSTQ